MELNDFELSTIQNSMNNEQFNNKSNNTIKQLQENFNFNNFVDDENEDKSINCNYYNIDDFKQMCNQEVSKSSFSIFHTNICSIQGYFDKL